MYVLFDRPAPGALPQIVAPDFGPSRGNISTFGGWGDFFWGDFLVAFLAKLGPPPLFAQFAVFGGSEGKMGCFF